MSDIVENLAAEINRAYRESLELADHARGRAAEAVERALECGRLMLRQKEELQQIKGKPRPGWLEWLSQNCPEIEERTAQRYMSLAKKATHVSGYLEDCSTMRQAYLATGLLKEPPKEKAPPGPETPWVKYCRPLDAFRLWYHRRIKQSPMERWGENAVRLLNRELQWFANLHAETGRILARFAARGEGPDIAGED